MEKEFNSCMEEAIIKMVGKITLEFPNIFDVEKQRKLKSTLEESLYGYDVITQSKELICSDLIEKINIFIATRRLEGIAESTLENYKRTLLLFSDYFCTKTVSMIKAMDVRYYLAVYQKTRKLKNSSLNGIIYVLKSFFGWLEENEIIERNPMKQIKEIKVEKKLINVMNDEQAELLRNGCKNVKEELLVNFALDTGCRVSEIANIDIRNINMDKLTCKVIITKGSKERYVYFTEKTKLLLKKYLSERKEFEEVNALFLGDKFPHQRITSRALQTMFSKIKHRSNLDNYDYITMHNCRKYLATRLCKRKADITSVQKILGHSSPSTSLIYAKISDNVVENDYRSCY